MLVKTHRACSPKSSLGAGSLLLEVSSTPSAALHGCRIQRVQSHMFSRVTGPKQMRNCIITSFLKLSWGVLHCFAYCHDIKSPFPPCWRMKAWDIIYCIPRSPLQPVPCAEQVKSSAQEGPSRNVPICVTGFIKTSSWDQLLPSMRTEVHPLGSDPV